MRSIFYDSPSSTGHPCPRTLAALVVILLRGLGAGSTGCGGVVFEGVSLSGQVPLLVVGGWRLQDLSGGGDEDATFGRYIRIVDLSTAGGTVVRHLNYLLRRLLQGRQGATGSCSSGPRLPAVVLAVVSEHGRGRHVSRCPRTLLPCLKNKSHF